MLAKLKRLALDPCRPQFAWDNIKPLWDQILRLRKVMVLKDSETPWRKRKLDEFINDKLRARSGLEKQVPTECSFLDDIVHRNCPGKDVSPTVDSDESVNGSNPLSPENEAPTVEISNAIHFLNLPTLDGLQRRHLQPPRRSIRLLNFIGDHLQRKAIPVGPHFQADVPEWSGPVNRSVLIAAYKSDSDNSKWLGSRVWPIEIGNMKTTGRTIGKGRPNSCCCVSPGFSDCTIRHIVEERLLLQCDLGPAFFSWKFDEMGEQVSNSWSPKEQQTFEKLVKTRPSSNGKNFLKRALKCFSNKYRKDITNYYFNVYIPRRMSLQTRLSPVKQVDTDDEYEIQDFNYMVLQKRSGGRSLTICNRKINYEFSSSFDGLELSNGFLFIEGKNFDKDAKLLKSKLYSEGN
ncbi:UNVERIFIED_CONTAM: AT-rich interactive domain-containing protein 1 [Sesamum calycinum]|uniref:AT-rich interactive domain-containing protein 1 n=1 Tax=Sesamum calycinum TaxID=2727403 RepID=A0AAW2NV07_9LAMI